MPRVFLRAPHLLSWIFLRDASRKGKAKYSALEMLKTEGAALWSLLGCCENELRGCNGGLLIVVRDGASNP
jgi:hypothetical protein